MEYTVKEQKYITLCLTDRCNLSCIYCYEHNKSDKKMSLSTACNIIKKELNADNDFKKVNISLFGGEPFLSFDTIIDIVDYTKTNTFKKDYHFEITTNGTLVHGKIQEWLLENKEYVSCSLSLDGARESHNVNRSNSFDLIDLDFFVKNYPSIPIKMTISTETLPRLCEDVLFCTNKGFIVFNNFAYGINWNSPNNVERLNGELKKLIDYYLENPNVKPCSLLNDSISQIAYNEGKKAIKSWCAAGFQTSAYDCNGKEYPCQFFMPITDVPASVAADTLHFSEDIDKSALIGDCKDCPVVSACPTCFGSNYVNNGNVLKRDMNICKLIKTTLKARAYFYGILWDKGNLKLTKDEEYALLKSILIIEENL